MSSEQIHHHISIYDTSQEDDDPNNGNDDDLNVSQTDSDMQVEVASICVISSSDEADGDEDLHKSNQEITRTRKCSASLGAAISEQPSDKVSRPPQNPSKGNIIFDQRSIMIGEMSIPEKGIVNREQQMDSELARAGKITIKQYQQRRQNEESHIAMTERTSQEPNNEQQTSRVSPLETSFPENSNIRQTGLIDYVKIAENSIQDSIDNCQSHQNDNTTTRDDRQSSIYETSFDQNSDNESLGSRKSSFKESSCSEDADSSSRSSSSGDKRLSKDLSDHEETISQIENEDRENVDAEQTDFIIDFDLVESKFEVLTPTCSVYRWNISDFSSKLFQSDLEVFSKPFKVRDLDDSNTFELKMTWFSDLNDGVSIMLLENGINQKMDMNVILTCEGNGYFNSQPLIANTKPEQAFLHINHVNVETSELSNSKSVMDFIENDTLFMNCYFKFS